MFPPCLYCLLTLEMCQSTACLVRGGRREEKAFLQRAASSQSIQLNHWLKPFLLLLPTSFFFFLQVVQEPMP